MTDICCIGHITRDRIITQNPPMTTQEIDASFDLPYTRLPHPRYNGKHIYFTPDEDDTYFRLIMPNIYELEDNRVKVLEACNTITRDYKVVKAYLVKDRLWLSIEMFVDSTPEVGDFFERCCRILISAYEDTAKEIFN